MNNNKDKVTTLKQYLLRHALPRQASILILLAIVQAVLFFFYSQPQITQRQQTSITRLMDAAQNGQSQALAQMRNLASNDFVINSLVDVEQQQYYLPLFFQSLRINNDDAASIGFFSFEGELIASKNYEAITEVIDEYPWQIPVLEQGEEFIAIDTEGVTLAVPVLFNVDFIEGALVFHASSLEKLIRFEEDHADQIIVDEIGNVLFSSSQSPFKVGTQLNKAVLTDFVYQERKKNGLTFIVFESYSSAYTSVLYLLPFVVLTIISALIAVISSTSMVSQLGATTLQKLGEKIKTGFKNLDTDNDEQIESIKELNDIQRAFQSLEAQISSLSLSNDRVNSVIDAVLEFMLVVDNDNKVLLSNHAFRQFKGAVNFSNEQRLALIEELQRHLVVDNVGNVEKIYVDASGTERVIHWYITPFQDKQANRLGHVVVGEDLTLRKNLESALLLKTQAVDRASTSILISDISQPGEPIIYINKACETLTGYKQEDFLGKNCRFLQGKDTNVEDTQAIRKAINNREPIEVTLLNYRKDGTQFYNQLALTPISNDAGVVTHYIGIQQDVTAAKQTAQYLEQAKRKAEESSKMKANFLANMSHEIRTPINGTYGVLQLLNDSKLNKKQEEFVGLALTSTKNLLHIINDILDLSKIEAGKLAIEKLFFDPHAFANEILDSYRGQVERKGLTFVERVDIPDHILVNTDPTRVRQVIENLLSNAIKFTDEGQIHCYFRVSEESDGIEYFHIIIKDTGIGIAQDKLELIFDQFSQEDLSTTRQFGGTGLGLSITRQLCELLDGKINVVSQKGKGSAFAICIPITTVMNSVVESEQVVTENIIENSTRATKPAILLVEDNEINQAVAEHQLEGFNVTIANNGQKALDILKDNKHQFGVVLMDCQMPVMDGFEATRKIRSGRVGENAKSLPIIALTANAMKGDRELCIEAGMDDYISKPFEAAELLKKVNYWSNKFHGNTFGSDALPKTINQ